MKTIKIKLSANEKLVQCADCKCKMIVSKRETNCLNCGSTAIYPEK